jgi:hypothetical protein
MTRPTPAALRFLLLGAAAAAGCAKHHDGLSSVGNVTVPEFETRTEVPTGTTGHADFAVGDFNGDQRTDMVVASFTGEIQVMLGDNGTWSQGQQVVLTGTPVWMASGDLDGDLDLDLVVVRRDAGLATVLFNDGHANFTVGPSLPVGTDALAVVVGDIDGDGAPDILVSRPVSPEIEVFVNDGHGSFAVGPTVSLPGGGQPLTMAYGDVTHDGIPDLVVVDSGNQRLLVYQGGSSALDIVTAPVELQVPGNPATCAIGDLNGDGFPDLAVSAFDTGQIVEITAFPVSPGIIGFASMTSTTVQVDGAPSLCAVGDVTGDGRNDVVACIATRATMVVVPQQADDTPGVPFQLDATGMPLRPALADANGDGRLDLFALSGFGDRINLWLARADGKPAGSRNFDTGLLFSDYVTAADFDGDGFSDAAVGDNFDNHVAFLQNDGAGGLHLTQTVELGRGVFNVRATDIDGDGKPDVLVPVDNGVKVLRNHSTPGNLAFDVLPGVGPDAFGAGTGPFGVTAADLDGDGLKDLAVVDYAGGTLQVLHATAPFEFVAGDTIAIGGGPIDVAAADFTGDGIVDLAVSRSTHADILVLQNDGHGHLSLFVSLPVGSAPNYLFTADFDGDHRADIVVSDGNADTVTVLFGGDQGFRSATYPAGNGPTALAARDLTGDGVPDILVASLIGGDCRVLVNDGHGNFPNVFPFPGVIGATSAALGDFDADGDLDLVLATIVSNRLSLITNISK